MTSRSLQLRNLRLKFEDPNLLLQMVKDGRNCPQKFKVLHKFTQEQLLSRWKQQPQQGQVQGHGQAGLIHLQSHHNSSLLFWAKQPKPQLEMHFSKSAALVVVGLEFFLAFRGLKQSETEFVVAATSSTRSTVKSHIQNGK